jgi:hypothetical protein
MPQGLSPTVEEKPSAAKVASTPREVRIISHSNIFYWWPAWVAGYAVALITSMQGIPIAFEPGAVELVHPSNNPGIFFITVVVLLVVFTTSKLRGIYSILALVTAAFFTVLFAWLGWWDSILRLIPNLSARANLGFYLVFSTMLLIVWALAFFVFDRLIIWKVRPGQLIEEHLVGGQASSYDTSGLRFEKRGQDFFHDIVLGLGAGDLLLTTSKETIQIPNVLLVDRKVKAIERLIIVKPDQIAAGSEVAEEGRPDQAV